MFQHNMPASMDIALSVSDARLRAACDRCHELKNRCARAGAPDSRCERCERLDIDCVYSAGARMGRPPGQKPDIMDRLDSQFRPPKSRAQHHRKARSRQHQHSPPHAAGPDRVACSVIRKSDDLEHSRALTPAPSTALSDAISVLPSFKLGSQFWMEDGMSDTIGLSPGMDHTIPQGEFAFTSMKFPACNTELTAIQNGIRSSSTPA
jgi:hypothetical protein